MIWGDESPGSLERFEAKALPPAESLDPERLALAGVGSVPPREDAKREGSGLAETTPSAGGASSRRRLAPRHRDAVKTFFSGPDSAERPARKKGE
jgi:hypothetical protein